MTSVHSGLVGAASRNLGIPGYEKFDPACFALNEIINCDNFIARNWEEEMENFFEVKQVRVCAMLRVQLCVFSQRRLSNCVQPEGSHKGHKFCKHCTHETVTNKFFVIRYCRFMEQHRDTEGSQDPKTLNLHGGRRMKISVRETRLPKWSSSSN
jgi:hypothetical protein